MLSDATVKANKKSAALNIIWEPQPKQKLFLERPEYEAFYGGAAGGGKSDSLLAEALRQVEIPHYRGIIFRKTYPELSEIMDRSTDIYKVSFPKARFNESKHFWKFPSGAKIYFGAMQYTKDKNKYQGKRYDFIGFDELGHFSWDEYSYMFSRNRPSGPGTRVYRRNTGNPGGIGHGWVKSRYIDIAPPLTPVKGEYEVITPEGEKITLIRKRIFIPSTVFDNRKLLENEPMYLANLAMLPEAEKQALLYGSWETFSGQVFREWRDDPAHYDDQLFTHVINPFPIPAHWMILRTFDFGYAKPFSVAWWAVDTHGKMYRVEELYGWNGTPNVGVEWDPVRIASEIRRIETTSLYLKGHTIRGIADPAIFDESRGESIAAMMAKSPNFIYFQKADNTRLAGKMQIHYRMAFDKDGNTMIQIFNTCQQFIRTIPSLVYDIKHVEDVDSAQEDHIYDETRYGAMENPISPRQNVLDKIPDFDPLNMYADRRTNDKYSFYRI